MTRRRGRAPIGQRLVEYVPHGHWKTTTLIAALDQGGIRCSATIDGPINGDVFTAFVEQVLVPTLKHALVTRAPQICTRDVLRHQVAGPQQHFFWPSPPVVRDGFAFPCNTLRRNLLVSTDITYLRDRNGAVQESGGDHIGCRP